MSLFAPLMNPIRFYPVDSIPDFQDTFPFVDRMVTQQKWIEGVYPSNFYKDFLINKEIILQFRLSGIDDKNIIVTKPSGTQTLTATEITPSGWTSTAVYKYSFTPTAEGVYYFTFTEPNYKSDKIYVSGLEKFRRRLVEISYYNSENDYSMIFFNGALQKYTGLTYFTGQLLPSQPENEISGYESDRGNLEKLRSTPKRISNLILTDVHISYIDVINMIFSCDNLTINGVTFQSAEAPQIEIIAKSDLVNMEIKLTQTNNDYFVIE